ncbi:MAG: methylmalonyl-CoA mutase family protein [Bacteroidota bacterium]
MGQSEKKKNLLSEFPPISTPEWEQVILKDLKGADYAKKLIWNSPEGIPVQPYYRAEDLEKLHHLDYLPGEFPFVRGNQPAGNSWLIRQDVLVEDYNKAREDALYLLSKGVESVNFQTNDDHTSEEVKTLLTGLPFDKAEFSFEGYDPEIILDVLDDLVANTKLDPASVKGCLQFDPIGEFNLTGQFDEEEELYEMIAVWISRAESYPDLRIMGVNGRFFHNAGATAVQELGFSLAQANEYMVEMTESELPADLVAKKISFHLSVGSNYFFEIAKIRAARMLWARILGEYGIKSDETAKMYIHTETSFWNKTVYDPYVNLLRTTTEAMSAALGGISSLTVLPFDLTYEEPTPFAERIARNQQILLKGESNLDKVADPAAGSYYIENLTRSIAGESWKLFQQVEAKGGYTEAFYDGWIQNAIVTAASLRDMNIAQRKEIILGTNQYPDALEEMIDKADPDIITSPVADAAEAEAQPLNLYRAAEPFEQLRMKTEKSGRKPVVFLLTIGNLAMRRARAGFAANFFACAGYQIIDNDGFATVEEGIAAALDKKSDVVVLCSSDEEYATFGIRFGKLISGKAIPVIAGYPKEILEDLKSTGITQFIHVRSNILQNLQLFNKLIFKN